MGNPNREFQIRIDVLDGSNKIQHTFTFSIPPSENGTEVAFNYTEVFTGKSLKALKNTAKIVFTLNMLPGAPINNTIDSRSS